MSDEDLDAEEVAVAAGARMVLPVDPGRLIRDVVSREFVQKRLL